MRTEPVPTPSPRARRPWAPWVVLAAVVGVLAVVTVGVVATRDDGSQGTAAEQQLAAIQAACSGWHERAPGAAAVPRDWCDDMAGWMRGRMTGGPMMGGTAMWGDTTRMRATCQAWMATAPAGDRNAAWCDAMVEWMTRHGATGAGNGPGWMMPGGSMMGG